MNKREVLIILNNLRDIVVSDNTESKLILTQLEAEILFNYLLDLKKKHEKEIALINDIAILIAKNKSS